MTTPEEFPYIRSIHVNTCHTYTNFNIQLYNYKPFSHLILTGKNGSGKTTILNYINNHLTVMLGIDPDNKGNPADVMAALHHYMRGEYMVGSQQGWKNIESFTIKQEQYHKLSGIRINDGISYGPGYTKSFNDLDNKRVIFTSFKDRRWTDTIAVETPTKENEFIEALNRLDSSEFFNKNFQQYLVNKRVNQAFDRLDNKEDDIKLTEIFFDNLTDRLRVIFDDENLVLRFIRERFEITILLSDGREIALKHLPAGLSGLLRVLLDLFIRVDLVRKQAGNNSYDPCGIVLIDEPEVHLHLELQEQVLPILTELFPNIQFVVATHSPAVIASIKNATIFDLTTKETRISEDTVGRSYSDLMRGHFGLNNEYSGIADELFREADQIIKECKDQPEQLKTRLQQFFVENDVYLSPSFRVELESMILENA